MTKREKGINRTDLHLWKDGKAENDGHQIPGWGYNSRYKYLGMHNSFKKNLGSLDFPLGGNLHRSVQVNANEHIGLIAKSISQNTNKAFANTADYKLAEERPGPRGGMGVGGAVRQRTPGGTENIRGRNNSLYASEPNLHNRLRESGDVAARGNGAQQQTEADVGKNQAPEGYHQSHINTEHAMNRDFGGQMAALG